MGAALDYRNLKPVQSMAANLLFKHRRLLLTLPRQEGKTELGVRMLHDVTEEPRTTSSLFLAKDKKAGKKATREKFERIFDKSVFEVNTEIVYLKKLKTSVIFMDSVDKDPDRIRGGTYSMIHWSEVAFSKLEKGVTLHMIYDKIVKPTMSKTRGYALLESTNNGKNGWFDICENAKELGFHRLKLSLSDLVYMGLASPAYYDEMQKTTHPDVFRQEYECDWVSFQGKVYCEFDHDRHIDAFMPGPESWQQVLVSIDWGYNPSATCILFAYTKDGILNIFDEHYALNELAAVTAVEMRRKLDYWKVETFAATADHEPDRIAELNSRGIVAGLADKANAMGNRIQGKELFYFDKVKIHPRCQWLIKDLDSAVWHEKKEGDLDYNLCSWGHFDAEAAFRYLVRQLAPMENEEPEVNPLIRVDPVSAMAFEMQNRRVMGQ